MGEFLWQASLVDGLPDKLLGYPVIETTNHITSVCQRPNIRLFA
jgi:HK97 family phage major capsid protein